MLLDQIQSELKEAMKAHDESKVGTLRLLVSALKNEKIAKMHDLSDEESAAVLMKQAKQRRDSIDQFTKGGRTDLADAEIKELTIIEAYLPEQMSEAEIETVVRAKMTELGVSGPQDTGKLMGSLMGELKGKADGGLVKQVVQRVVKS